MRFCRQSVIWGGVLTHALLLLFHHLFCTTMKYKPNMVLMRGTQTAFLIHGNSHLNTFLAISQQPIDRF